MNYLAHAYLSFRQPAIITGNLVADFVKGRAQLATYAADIREGITIHRAIDTFTDQHPVTHKAKRFFQPACGLYSGVFTDLVFDHFLATDTERFSEDSLREFAQYVYGIINKRADELPPTFLQMFGHMQEFNWLYNYHYVDGIFRSMKGLVRRAKYLEAEPNVIFAVFMEHYEGLKSCYQEFFPELQQYVEKLLPVENRR
jgi:acyl carrier protein phosphodiesterase